MKPNFLIIGAMKCATTSLSELFAEHPQIFVCTPKEPEFFCDDTVYSRGMSWYESLFVNSENRSAVGEASTSYTKLALHPECAKRVAQHIPAVRLIYIARHPLKRMESHWTHKLHEIKGFPPLCRALREFPHLVDTSLYWKQISAYRAFFPDDQILVLFFEDFVRDPYGVLEACFRFLGVDPQVRVAEAERPRHVSAGFKRDKWWVPILQKFPGAKTVKALAPRLAKRVMERFREPVDDQPEWDEATRRWAIEQVAEDSRTFLEFYGKPADYWKFTGAL